MSQGGIKVKVMYINGGEARYNTTNALSLPVRAASVWIEGADTLAGAVQAIMAANGVLIIGGTWADAETGAVTQAQLWVMASTILAVSADIPVDAEMINAQKQGAR